MESIKEGISTKIKKVFDKASFKSTETGTWPVFEGVPKEFFIELMTHNNIGETLLALIPDHPKHVYVLNRYLGTGNGFESVPPDVFVHSLYAIKEHPDAWSLWAENLASTMTYRFRHDSDFSDYITNSIENLESLPVYQSFEMVDIVNNILLGSKGNSYADENIAYIQDTLQKFAKNPNNPFLKRMYVEQVIHADHEYLIPDEGPIKIAKDAYGYDEEFGTDDSKFLNEGNLLEGKRRNLLIVDSSEKIVELKSRLQVIEKIHPTDAQGVIEQLEQENNTMKFFRENAHSLDISDIALLFNYNESEQKELVTSYRFLMKKWNREQISKMIHFDITQLTLKEQFYFTRFFANKTEQSVQLISNFVQKYQHSGLKTFLSLGHGGDDMGQKILDIGERLPLETASKIFKKYAEIIDSVENILFIAEKNFKSTIDTKPELLQSIEQSLFRRGAETLARFHENINQNPDDIIAELGRINADTMTTFAIFKYAAKFGNKLPLEDISGAEFAKRAGNDFNADEISEMEHIYQLNWKNYGNQQLIQSVIKKFKESLSGDYSNNEELYLFKKNNQINAFVKFSKLQNNVKYASALNVDQSSKGFGLGEAMMDEALHREAQENILLATCDPFNESNMRYLEKGFVATGFTGDDPPVMNICWNEPMNNHIQSKRISSDDLVVMYLKQQIPPSLIIKKAKDLHLLHNDFPEGKSLTRCFRDPLNTGDWYAVYETISEDYETNIKTTE